MKLFKGCVFFLGGSHMQNNLTFQKVLLVCRQKPSSKMESAK